MANPQSCFSCGEKLPRNYESLMACPSCGTELWDDEDDAGEFNGKIIGAALGAAVLGAVVWAGIGIKTETEIGWLAWGIGALIGFGTIKAGGAGMRPAVLAAVLAACSICGGRVVLTNHFVNAARDQHLSSERFRDELLEMKSDALDFSHLKGELDDEAWAQFLVEHNYVAKDGTQNFDAQALAERRANLIPRLKQLRTPSGELDYLDDVRASYSLLEALKDNLSPIDILFLLLGIGTAFKMVAGRK